MKRINYLIVITLLLQSIVTGQDGQSNESWTIAPALKRIIKSEILGRNVRLQIGLPEKYCDTENYYGVIYYMDAYAFSGMIRETAFFLQKDKDIPLSITVGIDMEVNTYDDWYEHRSYILSPTKSDIYEKDFGLLESWTGGGSRFHKSLKEEIIPYIEKEFRAKPGNRTIVGHSLGGLFALYTLFQTPELFERYLVSSPSLPWDNRVIFKWESDYAEKNVDLSAKVFLSVGSLENLPYDMMVHHLRELAAIFELRKYPGLEVTSIVFEGETHSSVPPAAFSKGLRTLYSSDLINP